MGLKDWFSKLAQPQAQPSVRMAVTGAATIDDQAIELTGTTTFGREALTQLFHQFRVPDRTAIELDASLQREPDNPADSDAVAVYVQGVRVGYIPSFVAREMNISVGASQAARTQLIGVWEPQGIRARGWVWLGRRAPSWPFSTQNPPPLTAAEKRVADAQASRAMVDDALRSGGDRAAEFQRGMVGGVHYLETVEPIKELKRQGRLREALDLCYQAIDGAEASAKADGTSPAPWYTEQAAIIHRKLGERDLEIAVLRRWMTSAPARYRAGGKISDRLSKLETP